MELAELITYIKKHLKEVAGFALAGGLLGVLLYYVIPQYYVASGSFYISRAINNGASNYFAYEGYYGQQTAISYTNTVMGLFESTDVKAQAIKTLGMEVNDQSLRKLKRSLSVKKLAPQVIYVTVEATSPEKASSTYQAVADATLSIAQKLNQSGDTQLQIEQVSKPPVIDDVFKNIFVNMLIGLGFGFVLSLGFLFLKKYLKKVK